MCLVTRTVLETSAKYLARGQPPWPYAWLPPAGAAAEPVAVVGRPALVPEVGRLRWGPVSRAAGGGVLDVLIQKLGRGNVRLQFCCPFPCALQKRNADNCYFRQKVSVPFASYVA
jgi:hypothetical protein